MENEITVEKTAVEKMSHESEPKKPSFSQAVTQTNYQVKFFNVQKVLKLKIIPPLRKEHFNNGNELEKAMTIAYRDILSVFAPSLRQYITISRTNLKVGEKLLQVLLVIAPVEAEEDVARVKLNGLKIMNRTVFPTSEDMWTVKTSAFPKVHDIRINNLPALCDDQQLLELLQIPEFAEVGEILREKTMTDLGKFYTGKAKIAVKIINKEQQDILELWSKARASEDIAYWCEIPIYASIPALHECKKCKDEKRPKYRGHHENWCRINRKPIIIEKPEPIQEKTSEIIAEGEIEVESIPEKSESGEKSKEIEKNNENDKSKGDNIEQTTESEWQTVRNSKRTRSEVDEAGSSSTASMSRKQTEKQAKKLQTERDKLSNEVNKVNQSPKTSDPLVFNDG